MIKSIHFQNFKALRDATLPLGPFTLIVGPNGSGKSTAMQALRFAYQPQRYGFEEVATAGWVSQKEPSVEVSILWSWDGGEISTVSGRQFNRTFGPTPQGYQGSFPNSLEEALASFKVFSFDANVLATPVQTHENAGLGSNGSNLAAVLDALNGGEPERFEALNKELQRWLPEFDRILLEPSQGGVKGFLLRT